RTRSPSAARCSATPSELTSTPPAPAISVTRAPRSTTLGRSTAAGTSTLPSGRLRRKVRPTAASSVAMYSYGSDDAGRSTISRSSAVSAALRCTARRATTTGTLWDSLTGTNRRHAFVPGHATTTVPRPALNAPAASAASGSSQRGKRSRSSTATASTDAFGRPAKRRANASAAWRTFAGDSQAVSAVPAAGPPATTATAARKTSFESFRMRDILQATCHGRKIVPGTLFLRRGSRRRLRAKRQSGNEMPPRLRRSGKPFPPRPREHARTQGFSRWHAVCSRTPEFLWIATHGPDLRHSRFRAAPAIAAHGRARDESRERGHAALQSARLRFRNRARSRRGARRPSRHASTAHRRAVERAVLGPRLPRAAPARGRRQHGRSGPRARALRRELRRVSG